MSLLLLLTKAAAPTTQIESASYTDAVVGILTVAPTTGVFTSPANRS